MSNKNIWINKSKAREAAVSAAVVVAVAVVFIVLFVLGAWFIQCGMGFLGGASLLMGAFWALWNVVYWATI